MPCPDPVKVKFEFRRYRDDLNVFENDLVAQLPGLLITQAAVADDGTNVLGVEANALRFDFSDDWYSVIAYLDGSKRPTGHYRISTQTPLHQDANVWKGTDLVLAVEVYPDWDYAIVAEEAFITAVEEGWMRIYAAAKARECVRNLSCMLDERCLPQEVMDAVGG